jgi:hypothetical protein
LKIDFLDDVLLSCKTEQFASLSAFESYCTDGDIGELQMIKQFIDEWQYLGIFGNADIAMKQDWIKVLRDIESTAAGDYDAERSLCLKTDSL